MSYPECDEPKYEYALWLKQLPTKDLWVRVDLHLALVHRYLAEGNQLAAMYARYLAIVGMELLDRKDRPYLTGIRRFHEKEVSDESSR